MITVKPLRRIGYERIRNQNVRRIHLPERMNELGMTKTALIKQAEISMDTLNRAIKGKSVQMSTVVGICYALCVDDTESRLLGNRLLQP